MNLKPPSLHEFAMHGHTSFPIMIYQEQSDPQTLERIVYHWHEEHELILVTVGDATLRLNNQSYPMSIGDIAFIASNSLHSVRCKIGTPFSFIAVVFSQELLDSHSEDRIQQQYFNSVLSGDTLLPSIISHRTAWGQTVQSHILQMNHLFAAQTACYELQIKSCLYLIWCLLYEHALQRSAHVAPRQSVLIQTTKSIIQYIEGHYNETISLTELSQLFHLSTGHMCRTFKDITNLTLVEYINYYRISKSASLLRSSAIEISEVAGMVGFNNISYYNRVFRSYMHMTPSDYRKMSL